jgi:omega-6 fatty acid desaturase (delta-12 desaturase)
MLSGKNLILATKPYAKECKRTSWISLLTTLFLLVTALSATLLAPFVWARLICSILSGLLIVRMFIIYHDFQHHAILTNSFIATLIMNTFGLYILAPASIWKRSHDYHHKHNSKLFSADIGSFPIATKEKYLSMSKGERIGYLTVRHPLTIALGYYTMFIFGMCINSLVNNPKKHGDSLLALILHAAMIFIVAYFFGWQGWLFFICIPFTIACGLGSYLFYAQHNFPGVFFSCRDEWCYETAALESSSYMHMNPLMQWFTGNIGFHHIHHLNARIPFYRLPEVMKVFPELQMAKTTSLQPKDIINCLRLKVWDVQQLKMISLKEMRKAQVSVMA